MREILVITGPTASGKSSFAYNYAIKNNYKIISADSRQLYKELDIGTAKPTLQELNSVQHYLIDTYFINEKKFNAGDFFYTTKDILKTEKNILICGGTPFYLQTLKDGITVFDFTISKEATRKAIDLVNENVNDAYKLLNEVDTEWANKIKPTDKQRISRGLEVFFSTNKPLSYFHKNSHVEKLPYNFKFIILWPDREFLYSKINKRVDDMIKNGLENEVKELFNKYQNITQYNAFNSVGYIEWIKYFNKEQSLYDTIELIKRNTRRFAKRQFTFFKNKFHDAKFINFNSTQQYKKLTKDLL